MTYSLTYRRVLNRMGYYNYQRGLIYHHLDEEGSWNSHLGNCRAFILKAMELRKPSKVTVLGSGWLLDLPLKEMAETGAEICLVDIVHPPEVKEQVAGLGKVTLIEDDVSGGLISEVWEKARRKFFKKRLGTPDSIDVSEYLPKSDPGMVISLNILTQLENLPLEFLKKRSGGDDEAFLRFRQRVQEKHIGFLKKHLSVLITDIAEIISESSGRVSEIPSVVTDLPQAKLRDEWTWLLDPYELRNDIVPMQEAVKELSAKLEWRQKFTARGLGKPLDDNDIRSLREWIDALNSLANHASNNPGYCFPSIAAGEPVLEAVALGHPLLSGETRVCNDFSVSGKGRVFIITGANIAGKSTFLRTVAVNMILGMTGAPVCARKMILTPVKLFTSMRTVDSLSQNESYSITSCATA